MKLKLMMMLVAALVIAPVPETFAADAAAAETAKPKKKMKKKPMYTKFAEAMKVADNNEEPVLVLLYMDKDKRGDELEKALFKWPQFAKDYAKNNLILFKMKLKPSKDGKKLDPKGSFKTENERRFIENYGLDEKKAAIAKRDGKNFDAMDVGNYPAVICVKGNEDNQELLFRMEAYDKDAGPGVWLSTLDALLRTKDVEPVVSDKVQKILDDPTSVAGKKKR